MRRTALSLIAVWLLIWTLYLWPLAAQDPVREEVFREISEAFQLADQKDAATLSPQHYSQARKLYVSAQNRFDQGQKLEGIRTDLTISLEELRAAIRTAELGQVALQDLLVVRSESVESGLDMSRSKEFKQAEKNLREAALRVERGNVKASRKPAEVAADLYRRAVLETLGKDFLAGAEKRLQGSRKQVPKNAYAESERSLRLVKGYLKSQGKQAFSVAEVIGKTRALVDEALAGAGIL